MFLHIKQVEITYAIAHCHFVAESVRVGISGRKLKVYATKLLRMMTGFDEKRCLHAKNLVSSNLGYATLMGV